MQCTSSHRSRFPVPIGALLATLALVAGCGPEGVTDGQTPTPETGPPPVCDDHPITAHATLGPVTMSVDSNGTVKAIGEAGVSAKYGPVDVGVGVVYEKVLAGRCEDAILLIERLVNGRPQVSAYRLKSEQTISWSTCGDQRSTWDPAKHALHVKLGRGSRIALLGGEVPPRTPRCAAPAGPAPRPKPTPSAAATSAPSTTFPTPPSAAPSPALPQPSTRGRVLIPDGTAAVDTAPRAQL